MRHSARLLIISVLMLSVLVFCVQNASAVQDPYQQVLDLQKQARAGDAGAQYLLGFMYDEGQGVAKDPQEAIKWYTQAAKQGHSDAQLTLGFMYAEGRGVAKDLHAGRSSPLFPSAG